MYNVYNKSESIFLWDANLAKEIFIGNEEDLIIFLAKNYKKNIYWLDRSITNSYLDNFYCNENEFYTNYPQKSYIFFDGNNRILNPKDYEKSAYDLYLKKYKKLGKKDYYSWRNPYYKGTFRRTPVEGIHRYKGPRVKPRRIKPLKKMYANPEFKEFNRGSHKDVPDGWWDDWYRCVEKNWKSQRKTQWKVR